MYVRVSTRNIKNQKNIQSGLSNARKEETTPYLVFWGEYDMSPTDAADGLPSGKDATEWHARRGYEADETQGLVPLVFTSMSVHECAHRVALCV